jgi:hypothetical protein
MAEIKLAPILHPDMKIPVRMDNMKMFFKVPSTKTIGDLVDDVEEFFEWSLGMSGRAVKLCGTVIWNSKDLSTTLPRDGKIGDHFLDGEIFSVYGNVTPKLSTKSTKIPNKAKTRVVIFRGFHDSGQTDLVNYMLAEQRAAKITAIENEFGDVCIDDLETCLNRILDDMQIAGKIDVIAIEITSMADPVPIIKTFTSNLRLAERLRFDGIIAAQDCKHVWDQLDDKIKKERTNKCREQKAYADKMIRKKLELSKHIDMEEYGYILPAGFMQNL